MYVVVVIGAVEWLRNREIKSVCKAGVFCVGILELMYVSLCVVECRSVCYGYVKWC